MLERKLLAAAVLGAFALPGIVLAADPPKSAIPTLDQVLEASGVSLNGYIDAGYEYSNKEPSDRVFDTKRNSFDLHQVGLTVAKQPKEGFGGLVNITAGSDAQVIHSNPITNPDSSRFDVTQAYVQYATGAWTVIGGKFESAVEQGGAHPVLALFYFDLRQSDDGEIRQPVGEMNLYGDRRRFHAG